MRKTNKGFTLVELLVVIGIVAALIAILLPTLGGVRARAASVSCLSNVRQIAVAALMYAQEQKWYVTYLPPTATAPAKDRKELLHPYLQQGKSNADTAGRQVWTCPSNTNPDLEASYGFNINLNGTRLNRIRRWSETVALVDAGLKDQPAGSPSLSTHCWPPGRVATTSSCRPNHLRHPQQLLSVGFVDGHAQTLPMRPPFYPGIVGGYTPNGITDPSNVNYTDQLWDLK